MQEILDGLFWSLIDTLREWGACPNAMRQIAAVPEEDGRIQRARHCPVRQAAALPQQLATCTSWLFASLLVLQP